MAENVNRFFDRPPPVPTGDSAVAKLAFILMAATETSRAIETILDLLERNLGTLPPALLEELDKPVQAVEAAMQRLSHSLNSIWV